MDMESRRLWEQYTKVKETMLERTHIAEAPWWIIEEAVTLPERVHNPDYLRNPVPKEMFVPPSIETPVLGFEALPSGTIHLYSPASAGQPTLTISGSQAFRLYGCFDRGLVFSTPDTAVDDRKFPAMAFNGGCVTDKIRGITMAVAITFFLFAKILASEAACAPLAMALIIPL
jgi:hypothetical protein